MCSDHAAFAVAVDDLRTTFSLDWHSLVIHIHSHKVLTHDIVTYHMVTNIIPHYGSTVLDQPVKQLLLSGSVRCAPGSVEKLL